MIRLEHVSKLYPPDVKAVDDVSFEISGGEKLVLLGTSGSGKSTILRLVNRLIELSSGRITVGETDINRSDPIKLRRNIGYAIQHIGLFPHMTIGENISVVPRLFNWERKRIDKRVDELLNMVGLQPEQFRHRYPSQLSGGQMQRVGVARALAADPPVVLMDEPFGALDPITREQLQNEFLELESQIKKTIIFVTHDIFEAVKMGDRIALLNEGKLEQIATPSELVEKPANEFVDSFLGQHRFQLALLTRTVSEAVPESAEDGRKDRNPLPAPRLQTGDSLIKALDLFRKAGRQTLSVCEGDRFTCNLKKSALLEIISGILGETGEK